MSAAPAHDNSHWKASIMRAAGAGALVAALGLALPAQAASPSQDNCDRLAGSQYDTSRNMAFAPVREAGLKGANSQAIVACRAALDETNAPRFAFQLGRALDGAGDTADAMNAFDQASQRGYAIAKVHLGMSLGELGEEEAAFALFRQAADAGNALGAYNVGVLYRDGAGTAQNTAEAVRWFTAAWTKGYAAAGFNLGVLYDEGQLVPQDNSRAMEWYKRAAAKGQVDAMVNLALMYEGGQGTTSDLTAAANWYGRAAKLGDGFAEDRLKLVNEALATAQAKPLPPAVDRSIVTASTAL